MKRLTLIFAALMIWTAAWTLGVYAGQTITRDDAVESMIDFHLGEIDHDELREQLTNYRSQAAISTPEPVGNVLTCARRTSGQVIRDHVVARNANSDVEVTFVNPSGETWAYGVRVRETVGRTYTGYSGDFGYKFILTSAAEWQIVEYPRGSSTVEAIIDAGYPEDHGAVVNTEPGGMNQLTVLARTATEPFRFFVNGVEMPVTVSRWDHLYLNYHPYTTWRLYALTTTQKADYEGLCTRFTG